MAEHEGWGGCGMEEAGSGGGGKGDEELCGDA